MMTGPDAAGRGRPRRRRYPLRRQLADWWTRHGQQVVILLSVAVLAILAGGLVTLAASRLP